MCFKRGNSAFQLGNLAGYLLCRVKLLLGGNELGVGFVCYELFFGVLGIAGVVFVKALLVFPLAFYELFPGVSKLVLRLAELGEGFLQLLFAVPVFLPALVQLSAGILQLLFRFGELFVRFFFPVVQFILSVVDLFQGFVYYVVVAELCPPVAEVLKGIYNIVNIVVVFVCERGELFRALHLSVGNGVVIQVKCTFGKIYIRSYIAGADRSGATFHADVVRADGGAYYGEILVCEAVLVVVAGVYGYAVSHRNLHSFQQVFVYNTLVRAFRHSAGGDCEQIHAVCYGIRLCNKVAGPCVDAVRAYSPLYVVLRPQGFNVVFGQAEGGEHLYIHELLLIQIFVAGVFHIRRCGLETGEKRYGESYEYGYGKKTVFAVFYFPYEIFS